MRNRNEEEEGGEGEESGKEKRSEIVVGNAHDTRLDCETYVYGYTRRVKYRVESSVS